VKFLPAYTSRPPLAQIVEKETDDASSTDTKISTKTKAAIGVGKVLNGGLSRFVPELDRTVEVEQIPEGKTSIPNIKEVWFVAKHEDM
jgi:hypothetical protein